MANLSEQQHNILKFFEEEDKKVSYQPVRQIYLNPPQNQLPACIYQTEPLLIEIDYDEDQKTDEMRHKLAVYKEKSKIVEEVGNMVYEYDKNFRNMLEQRDYLVGIIEELNKETSDLVDKQKKFIDLSIGVKESLDYYLYIDKFEFNWTCQPSYRDMFEDQLQPIISQLTDAIQFFTTNSHFTNFKKYLNSAISNRTKVTSFTKSFFIKILNKQYSYSFKNSKADIWTFITNFYTKSKLKFIQEYISIFPQFRRNMKELILMTKENATDEEIRFFEVKELEIEEFQFNESSLALIKYLEKSIPEIYEEVILKFISFYRINFHEAISKNIFIDNTATFEETFRQSYIQAVYMIASEGAYLVYCCKPTNQGSRQFVRKTLGKIGEYYKLFLSRLAKDPSKNKNPLIFCNQLNNIYDEIDKFFSNFMSGNYESYVFGAVCHLLEAIGVDCVKAIILDIGKKIQSDLQAVCHNFLPKFKLCTERDQVTQQVRQFIQMMPNLQFCSKQAEQYLVSSLDIIIKSIKETSHRLQSRVESYAWNLQIFSAIEEAINKNQFKLIKKQMRLQMNEASSVVERMRNVVRGENLLQYTSDLFSVLKTGVPTLNELTLDFKKFISEYHIELKQKFIKDMVFIHAKNMIQFLQQLKQANEEQATTLCEYSMLKNLYNSYILSIEKFIDQSKQIFKQREQFKLYSAGEQNLRELMREIQEILIDLMSNFYIESSKYKGETQNFESIGELKKRLKEKWEKNE